MTRLAQVFRGSEVESSHSGSVAVVDSLGRLLAFTGEPVSRTFLRSAAKPFQAIPLLEYGGGGDYELTGEELALICGSHGGEPKHVSTAAALLRKGEFDESDLLCGAHMPYDDKAAADLRANGEAASPLHNNCSGKHAGMLLATQAMDLASEGYIDAEHPLQNAMRSAMAEFAGLEPAEVPIAIDGCGVPTFHLSLHRAAFAYARLMATAEGGAGGMSQFTDSARRIAGSMARHPDYVAGNWSMTTSLIREFDGRLIAKEGAEGFYAMALTPSFAASLDCGWKLEPGTAAGIALKIDDGSMTRGRNPAILRTLQLLGVTIPQSSALNAMKDWPMRNVVGRTVGAVRSEFQLNFV